MIKYILPTVAALLVGLLFWLTVEVGAIDKPEMPASYYIGMAIGNLLMPLLFAGIAGFIKRSFSKDTAYNWRMFYIFLISFTFVSVLGKYSEWQAQRQTEQGVIQIEK